MARDLCQYENQTDGYICNPERDWHRSTQFPFLYATIGRFRFVRGTRDRRPIAGVGVMTYRTSRVTFRSSFWAYSCYRSLPVWLFRARFRIGLTAILDPSRIILPGDRSRSSAPPFSLLLLPLTRPNSKISSSFFRFDDQIHILSCLAWLVCLILCLYALLRFIDTIREQILSITWCLYLSSTILAIRAWFISRFPTTRFPPREYSAMRPVYRAYDVQSRKRPQFYPSSISREWMSRAEPNRRQCVIWHRPISPSPWYFRTCILDGGGGGGWGGETLFVSSICMPMRSISSYDTRRDNIACVCQCIAVRNYGNTRHRGQTIWYQA